jgi:hypothetical protein
MSEQRERSLSEVQAECHRAVTEAIPMEQAREGAGVVHLLRWLEGMVANRDIEADATVRRLLGLSADDARPPSDPGAP